ncbi:hypothetical protein ABS858_06625 [Vibrio neptunius]|uniref:hypothetical protein n=1 Tax=Vibrio neptunius TaxID=170651 RepID=UPI0033145071
MTEDIHYCQGESIYTDSGKYALPATSPCHKPCKDMAGLSDYDPKKTGRARFLLAKLREKHGIGKRASNKNKPMTFVCTGSGCIDADGTVNNAQ